MRSAFEFCLPTSAADVPDRPNWLHEVKYDGYRFRLERDGDRVRLISRGGTDWSDRFPLIVEAARKMRHRQFVIDGEAVLLAVTGVSDFDGLHSEQGSRHYIFSLRCRTWLPPTVYSAQVRLDAAIGGC